MSSTSFPLPLGRRLSSDFLNDTTNIFRVVGVSQDNGPLVTSVAMALGMNQADVIKLTVSKLTIMNIASTVTYYAVHRPENPDP
jgi:hypothetical protein